MTTIPAQPLYDIAGAYDTVLVPYQFDGHTDEQLLTRYLDQIASGRTLTVLELGCGTGRMTTHLLAHAAQLLCVDASDVMLDGFRRRHPRLTPLHADARAAAADFAQRTPPATFDLVAAFWSLNYPLLSCFEYNDGRQIRQLDHTTGLDHATTFLRQLMALVAPGGHLLTFFFDNDTAEQRLVTRLWERIAPFPGSGRDYTRTLLLEALHAAQLAGHGTLVHRRLTGYAGDATAQAARDWILRGHLRGFPGLADRADVHAEVTALVNAHTDPTGTVRIPAGMHMIDWHRAW